MTAHPMRVTQPVTSGRSSRTASCREKQLRVHIVELRPTASITAAWMQQDVRNGRMGVPRCAALST